MEEIKLSRLSKDTTIRKIKRRFLYYSLCTAVSFIFIRIVLLLYSIIKFDPKDYCIKEINYNSKQANSIYL